MKFEEIQQKVEEIEKVLPSVLDDLRKKNIPISYSNCAIEIYKILKGNASLKLITFTIKEIDKHANPDPKDRFAQAEITTNKIHKRKNLPYLSINNMDIPVKNTVEVFSKTLEYFIKSDPIVFVLASNNCFSDHQKLIASDKYGLHLNNDWCEKNSIQLSNGKYMSTSFEEAYPDIFMSKIKKFAKQHGNHTLVYAF